MARHLNSGAPTESKGKYICPECGEDILPTDDDRRRPGVWRGDQTVYHCKGSLYVFGAHYKGEPHHYNKSYGACWKCGRAIGCPICVGIEREVLCENLREHDGLGAVWATKRAFLEHGPLIRQPNGARQSLENYPAEWAQEYEPMEVSGDLARETLDHLIAKIGRPIP